MWVGKVRKLGEESKEMYGQTFFKNVSESIV